MKRRIVVFSFLALLASFVFCQGGKGKQITITVWDQFTDNEGKAAAELVTRMFEKEYPNVKVERSAKSADDIFNVLRPAFMSGDAPDVIYGEMGTGWAGPFFKAGYLLDLTDVWKARGWDAKLSATAKIIPTVKGWTYGVGHELEATGFYYNKTKFKELGIAVPKTIDELDAAMAKIKKAGYIPLVYVLDTQ